MAPLVLVFRGESNKTQRTPASSCSNVLSQSKQKQDLMVRFEYKSPLTGQCIKPAVCMHCLEQRLQLSSYLFICWMHSGGETIKAGCLLILCASLLMPYRCRTIGRGWNNEGRSWCQGRLIVTETGIGRHHRHTNTETDRAVFWIEMQFPEYLKGFLDGCWMTTWTQELTSQNLDMKAASGCLRPDGPSFWIREG